MSTTTEFVVEYCYPNTNNWRVEARFNDLRSAKIVFRDISDGYTTRHLSWRIVRRDVRVIETIMRHLSLVVNNS